MVPPGWWKPFNVQKVVSGSGFETRKIPRGSGGYRQGRQAFLADVNNRQVEMVSILEIFGIPDKAREGAEAILDIIRR